MKKKNVKRGAHAVTYLAVWWTLFSAFGVFDWIDGRRHFGDSNAIIPLTIWAIHLILIGIAIYAWREEIPRKILWIGDDDEILDIDAADINWDFERSQFRKNITIGITKIIGIFLLFRILQSLQITASGWVYVPLLYIPYIIFDIVVYCVRYFIFYLKIKKWRNENHP